MPVHLIMKLVLPKEILDDDVRNLIFQMAFAETLDDFTPQEILSEIWNQIMCKLSHGVDFGEISLEEILGHNSRRSEKLILDLAEKIHEKRQNRDSIGS